MAFFTTIEAVRILFTMALVALTMLVLIRLSCRCMSTDGILGAVRKTRFVQWLSKTALPAVVDIRHRYYCPHRVRL